MTTEAAEAESAAPSTRLDSLTSLRWFAASLVFLSHLQEGMTTYHKAGITKDLYPWFARISIQGNAGVSFFFILSGFVLVWSHREATTKSLFYRRRFARVYPAYAVVAVVAIPILIWLHTIKTVRGVALGLFPLTLLQAWIPNNAITYGGN